MHSSMWVLWIVCDGGGVGQKLIPGAALSGVADESVDAEAALAPLVCFCS